jgi:hypothetical protein
LSKNQTGFISRLGTEINLLKLREETYKLMDNEENDIIVIFIDLKCAYDSVEHEILFKKMEKACIEEELINAVKKIYSFSRFRIDPLLNDINVNKGVLQGSILSPILFNFFIDDLIRNLEENTSDTLAYADDVAIVCKNLNQVNKSIEIIEEWSEENKIYLNKSKSGILIIKKSSKDVIDLNKTIIANINNDGDNMNNTLIYKGIPIVIKYKYLGVTLDNNLMPVTHLIEINQKMKKYIKKNDFLIKDYFSIKSLKILHQHFQESRLLYGMSIFMDIPVIIKIINKLKMRYFIKILGFHKTINNLKLLLMLCNPTMEFLLFPRLIEVIRKYVKHFNKTPSIHNELIGCYIDRIGDINDLSKEEIKKKCFVFSISQLANYLGIDVGDKFIKYRKRYFQIPDKRDAILCKFILRTGVFNRNFVKWCPFCKKENIQFHYFNLCDDVIIVEWKDKGIENIYKLLDEDEKIEVKDKNIYDLIVWVYFHPVAHTKSFRNRIEIIKRIAAEFFFIIVKGRNLNFVLRKKDFID